MNSTCKQCQQPFEHTAQDAELLQQLSPMIAGKRYDLPAPSMCPDCRFQRRLCFRNLRHLYHRKCDITGKQILSCYPPDSIHTVYHSDEWWGDKWDPYQYGRDFDFSRTFGEQFTELYRDVPTIHQYAFDNENCEYINGAANCKNCYLSFIMDYCEDAYHLTNAKKCRSCVDSLALINCELCYECVDCQDCYRVLYSQRSINCSDSWFLTDCRRCRNCIGCWNLSDKEYHVFNEPCSPEEFAKRKADLSRLSTMEQLQKLITEKALKAPKKYYFGQTIESSTGDAIDHLKDCRSCFDCNELEQCAYCNYVFKAHHCMDYHIFGDNSELIYNCTATGFDCSRDICTLCCWTGSSDCLYCHLVSACRNCFGCSGLKNAKYCILNKKYSKEEYESLVPRIIEHMRNTGEWGEYFPVAMSAFAYNIAEVQEYFPLTKQQVLEKGWKWEEEEDKGGQYLGPAVDLPDDIADVSDDIAKHILKCSVTGKPYKIIPQELAFYRDLGIPLPTKCPDQRYIERMPLRNPRKLWKRECAKCGQVFQSTYSPDRSEMIYCEECYLKEVY